MGRREDITIRHRRGGLNLVINDSTSYAIPQWRDGRRRQGEGGQAKTRLSGSLGHSLRLQLVLIGGIRMLANHQCPVSSYVAT